MPEIIKENWWYVGVTCQYRLLFHSNKHSLRKERTSRLIFIKSLLLLINIFSIISPLREAYNLEHPEGITKNNNTILYNLISLKLAKGKIGSEIDKRVLKAHHLKRLKCQELDCLLKKFFQPLSMYVYVLSIQAFEYEVWLK